MSILFDFIMSPWVEERTVIKVCLVEEEYIFLILLAIYSVTKRDEKLKDV